MHRCAKAVLFVIVVACLAFVVTSDLSAQGRRPPRGQQGGPPTRRHTTNQKKELKLVRADQSPPVGSIAKVTQSNRERKFQVNTMPNHKVGRFPNVGNPHRISQIAGRYRVTMSPKQNKKPREVGLNNFGIAVNGIMFDPGAAEFWLGNRRSNWQYEALGGAVPLGLDENYGHVQPTGNYHYHGIPMGLLEILDARKGKHSPLIGWAADGFPIYVASGFSDPKDADSEVKILKSSYRVKSGNRPGGDRGDRNNPGGKYDGTFIGDYEFVEGHGDLDECNGRFTVTPEFPKGTYAYFLTEDWPVIPRLFRGTPHQSFAKGRAGGPAFGPRGPGRSFGGGSFVPDRQIP